MKLSYKYHTVNLPLCLLRCLKRRMRWIRAAGCIVTDQEGNMLLIRRNDRWDLPKGKVEPGETLLAAALRETREETGIDCLPSSISVSRSPIKTYHIFKWGRRARRSGFPGGWHLKQTSWFPACADGTMPHGKPQDEEGITDIVWVSPDQWYQRLQTSYGTLKTLSQQWKLSLK